jgi:flavodoxin I
VGKKIAIVYTSISGNTKELAFLIASFFNQDIELNIFTIDQFNLSEIKEYDAIIIGTYTWGNGDIPLEMEKLYETMSSQSLKRMVTGVFGTGDTFYSTFCGAVDLFRDMLYVHTDLAVTLKVELKPQSQDIQRCEQFVRLLLERLQQQISV